MRPVNAELISILVSQPVEANGILSRIEAHLVSIRDRLTAIEDQLDAAGTNAATRQAEILKRIKPDAP